MLSAQDKQFKLQDNGRIFYQAQASNPLPGAEIAFVQKGASALEPAIELLDVDAVSGLDRGALKTHLQGWLKRHIATVLEPLVALAAEDSEAKAAVRGIAFQVHEAMGILPREQVQDLITGLDQDDRRVLRNKKIRLGPILVFQPDLNKPAAVRLRALLWSLFNDKELPAKVPNDGIVSQKTEGAVDHNFHRAIGYPVYGGRAIRIDMLDRVINAVYEGAKDGQFKAQHQMAEWLGCPIADLYAVLEAMGHTKTHDPAEEKAKEALAAEEQKADEPKAEEVKVEETPAEPKPQEKPELATFRLKKGKAFEERKPFKPRADKPKGDKPKDFKKEKNRREKPKDTGPRVISAAAKKSDPDDSPFAILKQLKK